MFNIRSACNMAYVNSVCAFACPQPLWPERVVACRVSQSSVSSGCDKLLLVESASPDLFYVMLSLNVISLNEMISYERYANAIIIMDAGI